MKFDLRTIYEEAVLEMMKKFGYKNRMAVPRLEKVVVNTGIGSVKDNEQRERIKKDLAAICGQMPRETAAKKSIASFKVREGGHVGYSVTLRGRKMYDFLNKMLFVAIPRKRDFRGLELSSIDEAGNLTLGFKDHLVFPEMVGRDLKSAFGFSATVVTTAKNKQKAEEFLKVLGFPFKKNG